MFSIKKTSHIVERNSTYFLLQITFSFTGTAVLKEPKVRRIKAIEKFLLSPCQCEVCTMEQPPKLLPFRVTDSHLHFYNDFIYFLFAVAHFFVLNCSNRCWKETERN